MSVSGIEVIHGDCIEQMARLIERGVLVDAIVTDPPYGLNFMGRGWDAAENVAFRPETWRLALALLKPGGHLLAFGGTRTYHRMTCAIEDAGFEIRDCIRSLNGQDVYPAWIYGTGFPKSHNISVAIDKAAGAEREVIGSKIGQPGVSASGANYGQGFSRKYEDREDRPSPALDITAPATPEVAQWAGWGTALKPAWEPIVVARKPLSEGTVASNVLTHGCGALNIDACRVPAPGGLTSSGSCVGNSALHMNRDAGISERRTRSEEPPSGRWPANVIHDGSDDVAAEFAAFGDRSSPWIGNAKGVGAKGGRVFGGGEQRAIDKHEYADGGSAARFFYAAKASRLDRADSKHPTIKPLSLMRYLCRLVTPPGGLVLDPFAGSGTTLAAAHMEGFRSIGIEHEAEYIADIHRRIVGLTAAKEQRPQSDLFDVLNQAAEAAE